MYSSGVDERDRRSGEFAASRHLVSGLERARGEREAGAREAAEADSAELRALRGRTCAQTRRVLLKVMTRRARGGLVSL